MILAGTGLVFAWPEIGLLRAVGQTQRQLRSMARLESVIVSLFGTVDGLALGVYLGWA